MKNKKTYYLLVLDKSGSMQSCENETISGFNEQVQMIRNLQKRFPDQQIYVSLTTFSDEVEHVFDKNTGADIRELDKTRYVPNGSTALLDAIGESVMKLKSDIGHEIDKEEASAVVVIITDGYENASKFFDWKGIRKMIRELEATTSWSFSFLGANEDAIATASRMNIKNNNAMQYSTKEMSETMNRVGKSFHKYVFAKSLGEMPDEFLKKD